MVEDKRIIRIIIHKPIINLLAFSDFFNKSEKLKLVGELEITPYMKFNSEYGAIYWYLQYMLLKNGFFEIEKEEIDKDYQVFFRETNINFEWVCIKDDENYMISCIDGIWKLEIYNNKILDGIVLDKFY